MLASAVNCWMMYSEGGKEAIIELLGLGTPEKKELKPPCFSLTHNHSIVGAHNTSKDGVIITSEQSVRRAGAELDFDQEKR